MSDLGRILIVVGAVLLALGLALTLGARLPAGRLPGDFVFRRGHFTFYFPLVTSILVSLLLTAVLWLFRR